MSYGHVKALGKLSALVMYSLSRFHFGFDLRFVSVQQQTGNGTSLSKFHFAKKQNEILISVF
jgi:hypothetical protein